MTGLQAGKSRNCGLIAARVGDFSLLRKFRTSCGAQEASYSIRTSSTFLGSRGTGRETDHSSSTSTRLRTTGVTPSIPYMPSLTAQVQMCLFKSTLL